METHAIAERMRALGCDAIQGFALARAMPLSDLLEWQANNDPIELIQATKRLGIA